MLEVGTGIGWWLKIRDTCFCVLLTPSELQLPVDYSVQRGCPLALSGSVHACVSSCVDVVCFWYFSFQIFSNSWCYWKMNENSPVVFLLIHAAAILNSQSLVLKISAFFSSMFWFHSCNFICFAGLIAFIWNHTHLAVNIKLKELHTLACSVEANIFFRGWWRIKPKMRKNIRQKHGLISAN